MARVTTFKMEHTNAAVWRGIEENIVKKVIGDSLYLSLPTLYVPQYPSNLLPMSCERTPFLILRENITCFKNGMIKKFAFPLIQGGKTKEFSLVKSEVTKKSKAIF